MGPIMKSLLSSFRPWSFAFAPTVHAQAITSAGDGAAAAIAVNRYIKETFRECASSQGRLSGGAHNPSFPCKRESIWGLATFSSPKKLPVPFPEWLVSRLRGKDVRDTMLFRFWTLQ